MEVTDGDRYAIAMAKLSQVRSAVYEATRIIEHLFESEGSGKKPDPLFVNPDTVNTFHDSDPVTGLYAGQISDQVEVEEEDGAECLD